MKCCVLGTGTWGSALAQVLCDNGHQVVAYGIEESEVNDINLNHKIVATSEMMLFLVVNLKPLFL